MSVRAGDGLRSSEEIVKKKKKKKKKNQTNKQKNSIRAFECDYCYLNGSMAFLRVQCFERKSGSVTCGTPNRKHRQ